MAAVARDLDLVARIFATLTAVLFIFYNSALASRMRTFFLWIRHIDLPSVFFLTD
jgi:hypothetical protein